MISILLPTRKRPELLKRMVDSARMTAKHNPEIVVYVDDDDKESAKAAEELRIKIVVGPRITMTDYWNKCYDVCSGDIVMQCGDDVIFRTLYWDEYVEKAFADSADKILLVHGDDLEHIQGIHIGTHCFLHRRWVETTGYFIPPYFCSDNGDRWITEVAQFLGRIKQVPIILEHMHYRVGKSKLDATYKERLERHKRDDPDSLYFDLFMERMTDAAKLQAIMTKGVENEFATDSH